MAKNQEDKWQEVKLQDCISKVIDNRGKNPSAYYSFAEYPVIDNFLIKNELHPNLKLVERYIDNQTYKNFLRGYTYPGMVIMTLVGNGIGNVSTIENDKCVIIQNTIGFAVNNHVLYDLFLYYLCLYKQEEIKKFDRGSGQPSIKKTDLLNMSITLPPLDVQKKIAGVLGALDDKIELNNKINQNLEAQAQALFKSWFVDFEPFGGQMPSDWKIGKLDDIVDFYNGYPFKSNELLDQNAEGRCLHVFKQGHIKRGGGFNSDSTKSYFPKEKTKDKEKYILKKGDILMAMTDMKGNVAILGNTALMGTSDKFIVNQRVGLLRCKNIYGISYPYIFLLTNSTDFLHDLRNRANSGVQVNLSSQEIKNSELLIPDTKTNTVFNTVSKTFFEKIFENEKENIRLAELRDTLLPKLMSGEINVNDVKID